MNIPVTTVGGYLGAGKTTLINAVLGSATSSRIAVLVNDFGGINIDAQLIASRNATTIELTNGCACCILSDDLGEAFARVAAAQPPFDHVVVEASGVADPRRLSQWATLPGLFSACVVVVADVQTVQLRADDHYVGTTIRRQLAGADAIVLSRKDLASEAALHEAHAWLHEVAPHAAILDAEACGARGRGRAVNGGIGVEPEVEQPIWSGRGRAVNGGIGVEPEVEQPILGGLLSFRATQSSAKPMLSFERDVADDDHAQIHTSHSFRSTEQFDGAALRALFGAGVPGLVRAKGILRMVDGRPAVLQVVGSVVDITPYAGSLPVSHELVVIGIVGTFDAEMFDVVATAALAPEVPGRSSGSTPE